jgi:hypothetical protein
LLPQTMTVAGDVVSVRWIPSAKQLIARDKRLRPGGAESPWRATLPEQAPLGDMLLGVLRREASNPWNRWRVRLVLDGLTPDGSATGRDVAPAFGDAALEAIARWQEERVRALIARIAIADVELSRRVCVRLGRIAEVASDVWVPAWNADASGLDELAGVVFRDLDASDATIALLVSRWLDQQPKAACWIADDAGVVTRIAWNAEDESDGEKIQSSSPSARPFAPRALATVCVTNLGDQRTLAWASLADEPGSDETELRPVDVGRTIAMTPMLKPARATGPGDAPAAMSDTASNAASLAIRVHAGAWSEKVLGFAALVPVRPPGLVTGRWQQDPSLAVWLDPATPRTDAPSPCAALITRGAPAREGSESEPRWEVYIECATEGGGGNTPAPSTTTPVSDEMDAVVVYAGPANDPVAVLCVSRNGMATDLTGKVVAEDAVAVTREAGRWTARVRLPAKAIDKDGVLRLALSRTDARGVRWCWPRATPPWQAEPSRVPLDTTAW